MQTFELNGQQPANTPLMRHRRLRWLGVPLIWAVLGVIYAGPIFLEVRSEAMNHAASLIFLWAILTWCAWAPLTPLITLIARRYSLADQAWRGRLIIHVPAFLLISALHSAAATVITLSINPFNESNAAELMFWPRFLSRLKGALGPDLLIYAGILGVYYAIDYYRKYREREYQAAQLESQLVQAQLQSLRMQLHPHFLFNTLNGIVGLVRDQQNHAAVEMLVGLSELLRHALEHSAEQEVELSEELNFVKLYLHIQQTRFPDRLAIRIEVPNELMTALVPNLLLQPLAENAINHGIAPRVSSGIVGIKVARENTTLCLQVYDNGAGLSRDWELSSGRGIGLANTISRLQQLYGEAQRFDIRNRPEGGVEVIITIPLRFATRVG